MWSSVLLLALPIALDPVRLGINLLLISRPRPAQNLVAYWVGCVIASVVLLLVPLIVLHLTPVSSSFVHDLANPARARVPPFGILKSSWVRSRCRSPR